MWECGGGGVGWGREGGRCLFFMGGVPSEGLCRFGPVPLAPPIGFLTSPTLQGNLHPTFLLILYLSEPPELMADQCWGIPIVLRGKQSEGFTSERLGSFSLTQKLSNVSWEYHSQPNDVLHLNLNIYIQ